MSNVVQVRFNPIVKDQGIGEKMVKGVWKLDKAPYRGLSLLLP